MERSSLAIRFMKMIGLIASAYLLFASINYPFRVHSDRIALTLILTVICLASYLWIGKKMAKLTLKQNEIILFMVMSGIVLLEFHIAFKMRLLPTVDLSHIIDEAGYLLDEGLHEFTDQAYFGSCTNNIPLGILIYWVFKTGRVIGANDDLLTGGLWNVLLLLWMYVNAYRILIRVTKKETAIYVMLFVLANPVCIAYASYYYTDTVSMAFTVAGLSHMVWGLSEDTKFKRLHLVLGGFLLAFATKVRVTSCFIIISIVLTLVIYRKLKAFIRSIVFCVIGALIFSIIWIPLYHYHIPFETRDTEIPVTHYLMMGANKETSGTYFGPDVDFTKSFSTKEERIQATKEVWINRIRTNGILGNIRLILAKEENVWTEGEKTMNAIHGRRRETAISNISLLETKLRFLSLICKHTITRFFSLSF
ncbi:MAG: hypothetical protein IJ573_03295 [Clostridia bacterium]|nr:hypothetical protein [Clostridia bacterium]